MEVLKLFTIEHATLRTKSSTERILLLFYIQVNLSLGEGNLQNLAGNWLK